jgi:hypothetical protein
MSPRCCGQRGRWAWRRCSSLSRRGSGTWAIAQAARLVVLPLEERLAILRDAARGRELRARAQEASDYSHLVDWRSRHIIETFSPATAHYADRRVGDIAEAEGRDPFDGLMDIVVADELKTTFRNPWTTPSADDWRARAEICAPVGTRKPHRLTWAEVRGRPGPWTSRPSMWSA